MMMTKTIRATTTVLAAAVSALAAGSALAVSPCGDFGECKVLVETNASDGDIGFHFLFDGDELLLAMMFDPNHKKIFYDRAKGPLRQQTMTETFVESAEPLCFDPTEDEDEENDDEDYRTLEEFIDLWTAGTYHFIGLSEGWVFSYGSADLSFNLPPAPQDVDFVLEDDDGDIEGEISWAPGEDLGECWEVGDDMPDGFSIAGPEDIAAWEVVLEPEFEDDDPNSQKGLKFVNRIGADELEMEDGRYEVEVPDDYLESLPDDTLVKVEVGAITHDDNATFTEEGEWCVNVDEGCEED
jgi:hypothetical protein